MSVPSCTGDHSLHSSTRVLQKTYISRHVTFDELQFSFQLNPNFLLTTVKSHSLFIDSMPSIPVLTYTPNVPSSNQFSHLQHVAESTSEFQYKDPESILVPSINNQLPQSPSVEAGQAPTTSDPLLTTTTHLSSNTTVAPLPSNSHPMITRGKARISKPKVLLATTDRSLNHRAKVC